jgi:hypothetical protein
MLFSLQKIVTIFNFLKFLVEIKQIKNINSYKNKL